MVPHRLPAAVRSGCAITAMATAVILTSTLWPRLANIFRTGRLHSTPARNTMPPGRMSLFCRTPGALESQAQRRPATGAAPLAAWDFLPIAKSCQARIRFKGQVPLRVSVQFVRCRTGAAGSMYATPVNPSMRSRWSGSVIGLVVCVCVAHRRERPADGRTLVCRRWDGQDGENQPCCPSSSAARCRRRV